MINTPMTHQDKIHWMLHWAHRNQVLLALEGQCGFGRECVGISTHDTYPDYDVNVTWTPRDAYHKHNCVAVLGRGEKAEAQLYDWLQWFESNDYTVKVDIRDDIEKMDKFELVWRGIHTVKMVKRSEQSEDVA